MDATLQRNKVREAFKMNAPRTEMSKEESRVLLHLFLATDSFFHSDYSDAKETSAMYETWKSILGHVPTQIFLKRLMFHSKISLTAGAALFISQYLGNPGTAVMYAFYLHTKIPADTLVTLEMMATDVFPMGFFSEEQLSKIWDLQKVTKEEEVDGLTNIEVYDNLLDYKEIWN